jgi:hypothetical protein
MFPAKKLLVKVLLVATTLISVVFTMGPSHGGHTFQCYDLDKKRNWAEPEPGRPYDLSINVFAPKKSWVCIKK